MDHPQLLVGQHHGVFGGLGIVGVDFRVAAVVVVRHVDGFLAQGVGDRGVHLSGHGQLDNLLYILESRLAAQGGGPQAKGLGILRVAGNVGGFQQAQVKHVDDAVFIVCLADSLDAPDFHVDAGDLFGNLQSVLHGADIAHNQRAAAPVEIGVVHGADGNLRAVAKGIAHGNA